jgi:hypothetical protein
MTLAHTSAARNEFAVIIVQTSGRRDHCTVLADSRGDAITQVMDSHPDAQRISAHLSPRRTAPARRPCMELGVCQADGRCADCTQTCASRTPLRFVNGLSAWLRGLIRRAS